MRDKLIIIGLMICMFFAIKCHADEPMQGYIDCSHNDCTKISTVIQPDESQNITWVLPSTNCVKYMVKASDDTWRCADDIKQQIKFPKYKCRFNNTCNFFGCTHKVNTDNYMICEPMEGK